MCDSLRAVVPLGLALAGRPLQRVLFQKKNNHRLNVYKRVTLAPSYIRKRAPLPLFSFTSRPPLPLPVPLALRGLDLGRGLGLGLASRRRAARLLLAVVGSGSSYKAVGSGAFGPVTALLAHLRPRERRRK